MSIKYASKAAAFAEFWMEMRATSALTKPEWKAKVRTSGCSMVAEHDEECIPGWVNERTRTQVDEAGDGMLGDFV